MGKHATEPDLQLLHVPAICGVLNNELSTYLAITGTVNSPNCGHFGTQDSVLYLESVLYSGVRVISSPIHVVITVLINVI